MGGAIISELGGGIIPLRGAASSRNWGAASSGISMAEVIEGEMAVNAPEHMVGRDMILKAEIIEQPRRRSLNAHHHRLSRRISGIQ